MKLPNFLIADDLNRLKTRMGIPPDQIGNVRTIDLRPGRATLNERDQLDKSGLDVDKDDVVSLDDGTLSYKDRRVLLYIRDISQYGGNYSDPRFHFSDCTTVQQMRKNLRFPRFVIASRDNGLFQLHYIDSRRQVDRHLDVCQNCLDRLNYKGFHRGMREEIRRAAVQSFSIEDFFSHYPKNLHHSTPIHTDKTAPKNVYSQDFARISRAYRGSRNWVCETCAISLSGLSVRRYLHVHHINGLKNENEYWNLKAVCVHCHALEPSHGHISASLHYREFEPIWQKWRKTGIDP
jgi:5-methylcytosine-specific restriction endonuclease McrA